MDIMTLSTGSLWYTILERRQGDFIYAVTTMGVYCRPGCPSPRSLRENVRFFPDVAAAADCSFGRLLVAATETGGCYLGFAEPDDALMADVRQRFPRAKVVADDVALAETLAAILDYLRERGRPATAARSARPGLPAACMERALRHSDGGDAQLRRSYGDDRGAQGRARRRPVLRREPGGTCSAMPPVGGQQRFADWISLGVPRQKALLEQEKT
jgi:AraC family transcriptional regulator, regulatory protein of adaptative response / methylated-DNA-[protein]-cysteine methyltransferase